MRGVLFILLLASSVTASAQSSAFTSAGESSILNGRIVNWAIGSVITESSQTDKYRIYSGDIQPNYKIFYTQEGTRIELDCYPNPTTDHINLLLHTNEVDGMSWQLYSTTGKRIKHGKIHSNAIEIPVKKLSTGMYIINIYNTEKELISGAKLIKK